MPATSLFQNTTAVVETVATTSSQLRSQWSNPRDIFSLLLLIGGDIIQKALSQFVGRKFKPVAFSFGWVSYAFTAVLFAVGSLKISPDPDCPSILVNCSSGYKRENQSWFLGRLLRSHKSWGQRFEGHGEDLRSDDGRPHSFTVFVYEFKPNTREEVQGMPHNDWAWISGVAVMTLQLGIAAVPAGLYHEWEILLITAAGALLGCVTGLANELSQGSYHARMHSKKKIALTEGNGSSEALVFLGGGNGIDLEDLAATEGASSNITIVLSFTLMILWTALLITVTGLDTNTWYIIAVGGIGMIHNIIVAGGSRSPSAMGMHFRRCAVISTEKVMTTLMVLETQYPEIGKALVPIYFPGGLRPSERDWWDQERSSNSKAQN
jgi:hypothetical protein